MSRNFGPVSLSELTFFVYRAAFGAGCHYGIADDITTMAVWLAKKNDDPTVILTKAFDNIAEKSVETKLSKNQHDDVTIFAAASGGQISALSAAIAVSDAFKMDGTSNSMQILIKNVDLPVLSILGLEALSEGAQIEKIEISTQNDFKKIESSAFLTSNKTQSADIKFTIANIDPPSPTEASAINDHYNILISQEGWDGIRKHFNNSLVLATEESRLSGAGAGVIDTD